MNAVVDIKVPDSITLDVSRVGESVPYGEDTNPGETVRFYYSHGSHDGIRTVLVVKRDSTGLEGLTLERDGEYRRYSDEYIADTILIVEPFVSAKPTVTKRVRFDDAGTALLASLTGEQLAELYNQYVALEGIGADFDPVSGDVVVKLPEVKKNMVESDAACTITFTNKRGKTFLLYAYGYDKSIGFHNNETKSDNANASPDALLAELVKFLA